MNKNRSMKIVQEQASPTPRLLNIKKASLYSGLPIWAIRQLIWGDKLPYIKLGTKYYLDITDIENWINANKTDFSQ